MSRRATYLLEVTGSKVTEPAYKMLKQKRHTRLIVFGYYAFGFFSDVNKNVKMSMSRNKVKKRGIWYWMVL